MCSEVICYINGTSLCSNNVVAGYWGMPAPSWEQGA